MENQEKEAQAEHPQGSTTSNISPATRTAITRTNNWKPAHNRRQSWSKEDQKHDLQMSGVEGIQSGHDGFTERS